MTGRLILDLGVGLLVAIICGTFILLARFIGLRTGLIKGGSSQENAECVSLVGRNGKTSTPLRPSGFVTIDGKRRAATAIGSFIDEGVDVVVSKSTAFALEVMPIQEPNNHKEGTGE